MTREELEEIKARAEGNVYYFHAKRDVHRLLAEVERIPWAEREYEPEDNHRWTVRATEGNLELLCEAFDNFGSMYELAKNQLPLPF